MTNTNPNAQHSDQEPSPTKWRPATAPDGCIAALPAQSGQSCEGVVDALTATVSRLTQLLEQVVWVHVYHERATEEDLEDCWYMAAVSDAEDLLSDLERDWGHLPFWQARKTHAEQMDRQAALDLDDTQPRTQGQ